ERDYHYGVMPNVILSLRVIFSDFAMLEGGGRTYYVIGTGAGPGVSTGVFGREIITRGNVGLTVRLYGPHALGIQYVATSRDAQAPDRRDRHQSVETVTISYNFLGHTKFGAVEWRPAEMAIR